MINNLHKKIQYSKIHFIGIGGVSMSGIAHILLNFGYTITGSDRVESANTKSLANAGAEIFIGHNENNITNQDLIVYTAAISKDNPEFKKALSLGIKMMERSEILGELTKLFSKTIAISGTHGKTTTTSMISLCFIEGNLEPSIQVGTIVPQIGGNYKIGNSEYFIIEACEYVDSFLKFFPQTEIILNIDEEHLDYFKDIEQIKQSFLKYINNLPTNGSLIINIDNVNCIDILKSVRKDINILTYGLNNENADIYGFNIHFNENGCGIYDIKYHNKIYTDFHLNIPGIHNVSNSLACIATCLIHNIPIDIIKNGLKNFLGSERRFEYVGEINGAKIYDDYAHHPTEIQALLNAANKCKHNKIITIFQPHTYSRVKTLFSKFIDCFDNTDVLILTDIYAAREIYDGTVSSEFLTNEINKTHPNKAIYISDFSDIIKYVKSIANKDDIILTVGAGTITNIGKELLT